MFLSVVLRQARVVLEVWAKVGENVVVVVVGSRWCFGGAAALSESWCQVQEGGKRFLGQKEVGFGMRSK